MSTQQLQGKGFTIAIEERPGYLRAEVSGGEDSQAVSVAYWTLLGEECVRRGTSNLLVVEALEPYPNPEADVFEAVTDAMASAGFRGIRVAFVDTKEEVEANEYGMIIGAEKGLDIMMFSNESYCERWLRFGSGNVP